MYDLFQEPSQQGGCGVADAWPREPRERVKDPYRTKVQLPSTDATASIEINRKVIAALQRRMRIGKTDIDIQMFRELRLMTGLLYPTHASTKATSRCASVECRTCMSNFSAVSD